MSVYRRVPLRHWQFDHPGKCFPHDFSVSTFGFGCQVHYSNSGGPYCSYSHLLKSRSTSQSLTDSLHATSVGTLVFSSLRSSRSLQWLSAHLWTWNMIAKVFLRGH